MADCRLFSNAALGTSLVLRFWVEGRSDGEVGDLIWDGRLVDDEVGCLERLLEEETLRRVRGELDPMEARLARALEVLSRANEARERRLRLLETLVDAE